MMTPSRSNNTRRLDDGDIINKWGLYWWKSEIESEVTQKTEQVTLTRKGTIKDKSDKNAIESAVASFSEAKVVADGKRGVSPSGVSEVPSKFGWDTLQSCHDSCESLLRDMMANYIPADIAEAQKQGFSSPDASWFKGESIDFVKRRLMNGNAPINSVFDIQVLKPLVNQHLQGERNRRVLIWSLININEVLPEFT
jgi:asparagine synthetase B (glutamine-hydrolysing)